MKRRLVTISALIFAMAAGASAQTASPPPLLKTFASADEIKSLIAKAKRDRKDGQPLTVEPLLSLAPYRASLEYRTAVAPAAVHETEAELFYVIEGTGTMVTGGTLADPRRLNPANLSGTSIAGGTPQAIAKGDVLIVPERTPHQITPKDGEIVLMSLHVPRTAASP